MTIYYRKKELKVDFTPSTTVGDLRKEIAAKIKLNIHRIELRQFLSESVVAAAKAASKRPEQAKYQDDKKKLSEYGLTASSDLEVKDLGPQFSYRGVFIIEYLGPILIILAFALRPWSKLGPVDILGSLTKANFEAPEGSHAWNNFVQAYSIALWILHFAKREFETLFVHKFSRPTMPLSNLFKNSTYYWGFALAVGFPLVSEFFLAPSKQTVMLGTGLWLASQLVNLLVHLQFSFMRSSDGDKTRKAPGGPLFALVSCPNYTAEVLGWVGWTAVSHVAMGGVFTVVGLLQMTEWALAKHRGYLKSDPDYKKKGKKAIIPFVI